MVTWSWFLRVVIIGPEAQTVELKLFTASVILYSLDITSLSQTIIVRDIFNDLPTKMPQVLQPCCA